MPQKVAFASQGACNGVLAQLVKHKTKNTINTLNKCLDKFSIVCFPIVLHVYL